MPKFLTTSAISSNVEEIIKKAEQNIYIVSPYLKLNRLVKEKLEAQARHNVVNIRLIYGKQDLKPDEIEWISNQDIRTHFREHLHAKCYMNEKQAIVTSMNLYEFSERNNDEFGILLDSAKPEDQEAFQDLKTEIETILGGSVRVTLSATRTEDAASTTPSKPATKPAAEKHTTIIAGNPEIGYCIQNGKEIEVNPQKPLCGGCYSMNKRFNREVNGKHCHTCGKEHNSSFDKPVCPSCYSKFKDVLNFTAAKR